MSTPVLFNPTWRPGIWIYPVDLNHLLILPGCETSENLIVEDGDLAPPPSSQADADPRTQPLRQTSPLGRMGVMNLYDTLSSKMKF